MSALFAHEHDKKHERDSSNFSRGIKKASRKNVEPQLHPLSGQRAFECRLKAIFEKDYGVILTPDEAKHSAQNLDDFLTKMV